MMIAVVIMSCNSSAPTSVGQRTDALDDAAWQTSTWISAANAPVVTGRINDGSCAAPGASWFTTTIKNEQKVTAARWMTAGLGTYDIFVNGQLVGEEVLKPGFTHPQKTKRSFTYDITQAFNCRAGGENVLAAEVTPGWWADKIVTPGGTDGMIGHRPAFRGVLELTFSDGTSKRYGTNLTDWQGGIAGPVTQAGIFEGERYDARNSLSPYPSPVREGGKVTSEGSGSPLPNRGGIGGGAIQNTEFMGDILSSDGAEIYLRHDLALKPVKAYVWKEVEGAAADAFGKVVILREYAPDAEMLLQAGETLVVDFGQNAAAVPAFTFKAAEGTVLTCLPGELLNDGNGAHSRGMDGPEGSVHRRNLRSDATQMRLEYTFADTKDYATYCPRHTFFGYRFASITATGDVQIKAVRSVPVTSIAQAMETGTLQTGDESINRLIANIVWGMRSNYLSVPTDCPQRNERQGWTADTQVFAETGTYFANTDRFFHKWMRDMRDTQSPQGGFPGVAPWGQYGDAGMMRLGWADAGIIVPWTVWKQFADRDIINENWEAMDRFMNHINDVRYDHVALSGENGNYQWADWLSYEPLESCGGGAFEGGPKPEAIVYWNYLSASYWAIDAQMMRDMAAATGRDAARYQQMADNARAYLREQFLNEDGTFKTEILNTMQSPALFALKNHLVEGEAKAQMITRLRQNFAEHGGCLQTGFLGTSILMSTLTENGMVDLAYDVLFQRKNPSWLYSVDNGATTMWERWNSYMADKGMGPQGMNSFNHYAYGCVGQWLWQTAAGIAADPADPGFRHIIMRPVPDKRLGSMKAEYRSAAGLIKSEWHYEGGRCLWQFTIPEGASATVTLPHQTESRNYPGGSYKLEL